MYFSAKISSEAQSLPRRRVIACERGWRDVCGNWASKFTSSMPTNTASQGATKARRRNWQPKRKEISSNLHALEITPTNRMYIAGENGAFLYSPQGTGQGASPLVVQNHGTQNYYSITGGYYSLADLQY